MNPMNPLHWKREHQTALWIALCLGGLFGVLLALWEIEPSGHVWAYSHVVANIAAIVSPWASVWAYNWIRIDFYWPIILLWGLLGAAVAGALVYMRQLLQA